MYEPPLSVQWPDNGPSTTLDGRGGGGVGGGEEGGGGGGVAVIGCVGGGDGGGVLGGAVGQGGGFGDDLTETQVVDAADRTATSASSQVRVKCQLVVCSKITREIKVHGFCFCATIIPVQDGGGVG